jgi:hypothetical protein
MRQNGVGRDRVAVEVCRDEPSQRVKVEKPHGVCSSDLVEVCTIGSLIGRVPVGGVTASEHLADRLWLWQISMGICKGWMKPHKCPSAPGGEVMPKPLDLRTVTLEDVTV